MIEVRAAIEVMLTEKCARLIDKDGLAELEGLALDFEAAAQRKDSLGIVSANLRLHDAINRVADNREALRVLGARAPPDPGAAGALRFRARARRAA